MTTQAPISSPFHAKSTALEVVRGVDLSGKYAVVTGGYSGIGVETVRALAAAGADVLVPARDPARAGDALAEFGGKARIAKLDLGDLASVRKFARELVSEGRAIDLLINNAGVMACPETRIGPGWELQFGTNHIGHFALTSELAPLLKKARGGARVVVLTSSGHKLTPIRWGDIHFTKEPYDKWLAYGQSKTANSLFAVELDRRMKGDGVRAFAVHPGGIITPLQRHLAQEEMVALGWLDADGSLSERARARFKSPEQGAATTVFAATSPLLASEGGVYCEDANIAVLAGENSARHSEVQPYAVDEGEAQRLWTETESMLAAA